jgi:hypothetical protein
MDFFSHPLTMRLSELLGWIACGFVGGCICGVVVTHQLYEQALRKLSQRISTTNRLADNLLQTLGDKK